MEINKESLLNALLNEMVWEIKVGNDITPLELLLKSLIVNEEDTKTALSLLHPQTVQKLKKGTNIEFEDKLLD